MAWYDAHYVRRHECPVHSIGKLLGPDAECPLSEQISWAFCPIHNVVMHDYNGFGERFARPTCLYCQGLKGHKARVIHVKASKRGFYLSYIPHPTASWRREFYGRLCRYLWKVNKLTREETGQMTLEELPPLIGDSVESVLQKLREFEAGKPKKKSRGRGTY